MSPIAKPLTVAILALVFPFAAGAAATQATVDPTGATGAPGDGTLLEVTSQAEATHAPDVATVSAGVVTRAADANAAMRDNATTMDKVMQAIRAAGIPARDIQTAGVSLNPQYRYVENQNPVITGYQASNTVNLKVRDISRLGKVLDALVASGANQVNGPSFEIDQPEPVYDEARRDALQQAQVRAAMYAKTLGMRVRRIVSISEGGGFRPPGPVPMLMSRAKAESDTAISPGETSLSATLDVVFELGR
jgi:uncharacterized protein YggE